MAGKVAPKVPAFIIGGTRIDGKPAARGDVVEVAPALLGDLRAAGKALSLAEAEKRFGKALSLEGMAREVEQRAKGGGRGKGGGKGDPSTVSGRQAAADGEGDPSTGNGGQAAAGGEGEGGAGDGGGFGDDPDRS